MNFFINFFINIYNKLKTFDFIFKNKFFYISADSKESLKYSLIGSLVIVFLFLILKIIFILKIKNKYFEKKILNKIGFNFYYFGNIIYNFIEETIGFINKNVFSFTISIFILTLIYNILSLIPTFEEPTKDINVTIGLATYSCIILNYIVFCIDKKDYIKHWISKPMDLKKTFFKKKFIKVIEIFLKFILNLSTAILMFPIHLLERLILILSTSFRLFGNIYGGYMVVHLARKFFRKSFFHHLVASIIGLNFILITVFGFFEGLIQAFVFTLIGLNNIGMLSENIEKAKLLKD